MSEEKKIPKHWHFKPLGDVLDIQGGSQPAKSNFIYEPKDGYIQLLQIRDFGEKGHPTFVPKKLVTKFCKKDDILIARYGASLGRIVTGHEGAYNVALAKVIDDKGVFEKRFIFYLLKTQIFQTPLAMLSRSAQNGFSKGEIAGIELPIPPLPEQQAIVAKIEELLSDLKNGKQQLQTAQQQLKVYRQSLLKWAFEGKLTNKKVKEGELPKGWTLKKLGDVLDKIEAGKSFKCEERTPNFNEVGVLKVSAVTWQVFDEIESKTVIGKDKINKGYFVKKNDFLFSRANTLDLIGAVVIVNSVERQLMLSDKTLRFKFNSDILKPYILYYLRSRKGRREIQRLSTGNQESMRNIGQERIKQIEFPYCSIKEQQNIVDELESKLTVCDKTEETINHSLQQAETLRQSILKKAFEGKLINCELKITN